MFKVKVSVTRWNWLQSNSANAVSESQQYLVTLTLYI